MRRGGWEKLQATEFIYILWIMTELSVTIYIQKSSLLSHNLFPSISNPFCFNLAQLPKNWLNSLKLGSTLQNFAQLPSRFSSNWSFFCPLVFFSFSCLTFSLIRVSAVAVSKSFCLKTFLIFPKN